MPVPLSTSSRQTIEQQAKKALAKKIPCRNKGKKAIMKTKKMDMIERLIQSKTGIRL